MITPETLSPITNEELDSIIERNDIIIKENEIFEIDLFNKKYLLELAKSENNKYIIIKFYGGRKNTANFISIQNIQFFSLLNDFFKQYKNINELYLLIFEAINKNRYSINLKDKMMNLNLKLVISKEKNFDISIKLKKEKIKQEELIKDLYRIISKLSEDREAMKEKINKLNHENKFLKEENKIVKEKMNSMKENKKINIPLKDKEKIEIKENNSFKKYLFNFDKTELENKKKKLEKYLNKYSEYKIEEFSISQKAINSIHFFNEKYEEEILKMKELPKEAEIIIKCLHFIIDEKVDLTMSAQELFENMINNILIKYNDKSFKSLFINYFNKNKYLNLTREKYDRINDLIKNNRIILDMASMRKICSPISLFCNLLKDVYNYINLTALDGEHFFTIIMKQKEYEDIKFILEKEE